jgi:hypothetical protein
MKKIFNWFSKHLLEVLVLLLILVIALYIIHFAEPISDKAEKIVSSIAAIFATFFLFLAFLQSRLNNNLFLQQNQIMLADSDYKDFKENINQLILKDNDVFSKSENERIDKLIYNIPAFHLQYEKYSDFFNLIIVLTDVVNSNIYYKKYINDLLKNDTIYLDENDIDKLVELTELIRIIDGGVIRTINYWYNDIAKLIKRLIDNEIIVDAQKKQLFKLLDSLCIDFTQYWNKAKTDKSKHLFYFQYIYLNEDNNRKVILVTKNFVRELITKTHTEINNYRTIINNLKNTSD